MALKTKLFTLGHQYVDKAKYIVANNGGGKF